MKYKSFINLTLVLIISFLFSSCKKETVSINDEQQVSSVANASLNGKVQIRINVSNVTGLYIAVNDSANAGSRLVLAPGTYTLDPNHPNAGRLELLQDMSLEGQPGHPELVIIDGSALPATSFLLPPRPSFPGIGRTGVIRIGNGSNALEWLTVIGQPTTNAYSVIESDLITTPVTHVRVAHCIITGGQIGINIRNRDPESNGRIIEAEILYDELKDNLAGFGQGIGIFNARDVTGAVIRATLRGNYVHGNRMGIRAFNVVANQCIIDIQSTDDQFEENGLGLALLGAFNEYPTYTAHNNLVSFEAHGTTIRNNMGAPSPPSGSVQLIPGGIYASGGQVSANSLPGTSSGNKLEINLWGCSFDGNLGPYDINAFGARSTYPSANPAGINNKVNIHLNGISVNATVNAVQSFPTEPAGTNIVSVFR
jgi:hypothetical protein